MKRSELFFSAVSVPLDYAFLLLAAVVAYFIRFLPMVTKIRPIVFDLSYKEYITLVSEVALIWIIIFALAGLYTMKGTRRVSAEVGRIFLACSTSIAVVMAAMFFSRYLFESRFIIIFVWVLSFIFISAERIIIRQLQKYLYSFGIGIHRVVLMGENTHSHVQKAFTNSSGYKVVANFQYFDHESKNTLEFMAQQDKFDELVLTDTSMPRQTILEIVDFLDFYNLDFKYTADLLGTKVSNIDIKTYNSTPIIEVQKTPLEGWGRIIKRVFDIVCSALLIVLFSPWMVATAIAIKLDSEGTVFFSYQRVGQKRKKFTFIKFRSMVKDAHQLRFDQGFLRNQKDLRAGTPMMKFKNDPRITRVGKFIRRWSIDELPQLFLVFIGTMSLVGPRPHEIEEVAKYGKKHYKVLTIKPGITGPSQVSGRSDLYFEEEVKLDTYYIENWSLALDLQILLKTPLAILRNRRAL